MSSEAERSDLRLKPPPRNAPVERMGSMRIDSFAHLGDRELLRTTVEIGSGEQSSTAALVACIAEVESRKLHVPEGYPSIFAYCVEELHLSEPEAFKRIRAARMARKIPAIIPALAEGRVHLTAIVMLKSILTEANANDLLSAATHKSKRQIEQLLAERSPQPDLPTRIRPIRATAPDHSLGRTRVCLRSIR